MFDSQVIAFTLLAALMTMSPGVDTQLVVRNVLRGGRRDGIAAAQADPRAVRLPAWRSWREGFLTNLLNPKVIVFYLALQRA